MIGTQPRLMMAPLEYRYALDAVMPWVAEEEKLFIRCDVPQLMNEVIQRVPCCYDKRKKPDVRGSNLFNAQKTTEVVTTNEEAGIALWVEPLEATWQNELMAIDQQLGNGALLMIVASRPLACLLPERQAWQGQPLGIQMRGLARLRRKLRQRGWVVERDDGIHSVQAIMLNQLSGFVSRFGWEAWADRLEFAARLHYRTTDWLTPLSTVALLVARKEHS